MAFILRFNEAASYKIINWINDYDFMLFTDIAGNAIIVYSTFWDYLWKYLQHTYGCLLNCNGFSVTLKHPTKWSLRFHILISWGKSLVCYQTISFRSVYIKIINYNGSILAKFYRLMIIKHHAMKKSHSYSNRNKIYQGRFFVVEGYWEENVYNFHFCSLSKLELYSIYLYF